MASIDTAALVAATNLIHTKLFEAAAAQEAGNLKEAHALYRDAVTIGCRAMKELLQPHSAMLSEDIAKHWNTAKLQDALKNREIIEQFLNAEERLLTDAGVAPELIAMVMGRCIDFLERPPQELDGNKVRDAFKAAEFRVCHDAVERLRETAGSTEKYAWQIPGRTVFRATVGVTIIALDYKILGPVEYFGQLSTGYGLSWLPTDI